MTRLRNIGVLALAMLLAMHPASHSPAAGASAFFPGGTGEPSTLSVMTYNVKGLPWPVSNNRAQALTAIGQRLAELRHDGLQPHVVLLQEAFTGDAKAIGALGGYRFTAIGPRLDAIASENTQPLGAAYAKEASWLKGETEGKWVDSGLVMLSDYPIMSIKRVAFPQGACAGFDCLAAKGVLLARVSIPGVDRPVAIATTHLNSRRSAGVSHARSDIAFKWQHDAAKAFVAGSVSPQDPVIFAGDFNFGFAPARARLARAGGELLPHSQESLRLALAEGLVAPADAADAEAIVARGSDRQYFRSGTATRLSLANVSVPFGTEADGTQLSDHMGFVTEYRISQAGGPLAIADAAP